MSKEKSIRSILGANSNDKSVKAQAVLNVLKTAASDDERINLLSVALLERDTVAANPQSLQNTGLDVEEWNELINTHAEIVLSHLKRAFYISGDVKEFAKECLKLIDLFDEDSEQTFVTAYILFSPYVPYKDLPGEIVRMSDQKYSHLLTSNQDKLDLLKYVIGVPFSTTTDLASMILPIIDDSDNQEVRVAMLAFCLGSIQNNAAMVARHRNQP